MGDNIFQELHRTQCERSQTEIDWELMKELGDRDNEVILHGFDFFHQKSMSMFWLYVDACNKAGGDFLASSLARFRGQVPENEPAVVTEVMKTIYGC